MEVWETDNAAQLTQDKRHMVYDRLLENNNDVLRAGNTARVEVLVQRDAVGHGEGDAGTQETHKGHAHKVNPIP
jgi:hypothetical protein